MPKRRLNFRGYAGERRAGTKLLHHIRACCGEPAAGYQNIQHPDSGIAGYPDFSLSESNGKTRIIYDVYAEYRLQGVPDEAVKEWGQKTV